MLGANQAGLLAGSGGRAWSRVYKASTYTVSSSGLTVTGGASPAANGLGIIGTLQTAFRAGDKVYFEIASTETSSTVLIGGIQSATASTTLGASWIRFWTDDANPAPGTETTYYLGSHLSTKAFTPSSSPVPVTSFEGVSATTGWAIDTAASKVWVTQNGTTWLGGGDPATGTTPTFAINVTGWVPRVENYWISGPAQSQGAAVLRYSPGSFAFTPPSGF